MLDIYNQRYNTAKFSQILELYYQRVAHVLPYKPQQQPQPQGFIQMMALFPRKHIALAGSAIAAIFVMLLFIPSEKAQAKRTSLPLSLEITPKPITTPEQLIPKEQPWTEIKVRKGDNLSKIFIRANLTGADVHEIASSSTQAKQLTRIYPGQTMAFQLSADGRLQALKHVLDPLNTTLYERSDETFTVNKLTREPEIRQVWKTATINSSLYKAAHRIDIDQNLIMEMANIFGGVVDFVYDVRAGDTFSLLYEERYIDGKKLGNGAVLAAQFNNQGSNYNAFRYAYDNGEVGYYNEHGVSMRKAFLRAPLDFTRISSSFNPNRLHPIFKTKRPHRGIDYSAARGTPVYAAGDGRVTRAGYSKANGNYVVIKHGEQYTTKYLHLHKRNVKKGQRVKQQQIIGSVGSTGYATGPHLHYEFLVNGVHRNPRTVLRKLPKAESIAKADRSLFLAQIGSLQMQLAAYNNHHKLANADQLTNSKTL